MGRSATKALTVKQVESCTKLGYTADGKQPGLNLQVVSGSDGFNRSWIFRYTSPTSGKRCELGLGSARLVGLAEARELAANVCKMVASGIDPKEARAAEKANRVAVAAQRLAFEQAASQCIAARQHEWKNAKHRHQWEASLKTYAYPIIGSIPVDKIALEHVLSVVEPIWTTKTETATRVRQRIETIMDWAKARKLCSGDNPASLRGGLGQLLPKASKIAKVKHQPALPYQQIHAFVQELRQKKGNSPKALEFLILTAARSGEVLGAKWDEFDLAASVWTIPAERMKAGREHRIPLSARAIAIIKTMLAGKQCEFVFPGPTGRKGMSNGALLAVIKGKGIRNLDLSNPKFGLFQEVKVLEAELGDSSLSLNAFILSETHFGDLINSGHVSRADLEARNVLFMENSGTKYIEQLFAKMGACDRASALLPSKMVG